MEQTIKGIIEIDEKSEMYKQKINEEIKILKEDLKDKLNKMEDKVNKRIDENSNFILKKAIKDAEELAQDISINKEKHIENIEKNFKKNRYELELEMFNIITSNIKESS